MKRRLAWVLIAASLFLSACSTKEKVDVKIEKKNIVEEAVKKQIAKAEKKEEGFSKGELEMKKEETLHKETEQNKDEKTSPKEESNESNEALKKTEEVKNVQETKNAKKEEKEDKKTGEEKIVDEQVGKLLGEEDYNPTDESLSNQGGDNFVSQFGEDEFDKMINEAKNVKKKGDFDYDLTEMTGDMVYATVFLMMTDPDLFIGKKFKMRGQYYAAFYEPSKSYYHYCFISDAAGCCEQGIEFAVDNKLKYPDDFPEDATNILVMGEFEKYTEDGKIFVRLKNAKMKVEG